MDCVRAVREDAADAVRAGAFAAVDGGGDCFLSSSYRRLAHREQLERRQEVGS